MIKLVASDLDGTLLQNGAQSLTDVQIDSIKRLIDKGIIFVAASGRQYPNLQRLFAPVKDDIAYICENGALVMYKGEVLHKTNIERKLGEEILMDIYNRDGCEILLSGMNTSYLQPKTEAYVDRMANIVKNNVTVVEDILSVKEDYLKISVYEKEGIHKSEDYFQNKWNSKVTVVTSGNEWLDMITLDTNKGNAIKVLQDKLNISFEESAALGDNYNDIEMLDAVNYSFAMTTAKPDIIKASKYTSDTVESVLEKIIAGDYCF